MHILVTPCPHPLFQAPSGAGALYQSQSQGILAQTQSISSMGSKGEAFFFEKCLMMEIRCSY